MNYDDDVAKASLVLATIISIGGGLIYYGHEPNIFIAIGGALIGWAALMVVFVNIFGD
jgi:hypothetical protein